MSTKLILLVASLTSCLSSPTHNYKPLRYSVPQPLIRAFKPKGLEVSIPHTDGVQLFAFHANINEPLDAMNPGVIEQDVYRREGDQWRLWEAGVELEVGDEIFYRVFVVYDGLGYRLQDGRYKITVLEPLGAQDEANRPPLSTTTAVPVTTNIPHTTVLTTENEFQTPIISEHLLINFIQNQLHLQEEVASLKETNDILKHLLKKHSDTSTILTLDGADKVKDDDLVMVIQAIIREKLHLSFDVTNVLRQKDGLVQFRVSNLDEKLEVIKAAKHKLNYSRYAITY